MAVNTVEINTLFNNLINSSKATLDEQFDSGRLDGDKYAMLLSNTLNMVMQLAVSATQQQPALDVQNEIAQATKADKIAREAKNNLLLDAQKDKLVADKLLVDVQNETLQQQAKDNRFIKGADILQEYFGTVGAGGLKVSTEMNTSLFNLVAELVKGEYALSIPTSLAITKA